MERAYLTFTVDHQGDELFRELELAVVVATARDVHRHPIGIMEGFHKVIC